MSDLPSLSTTDVAEIVGVSPESVRRWCDSGDLVHDRDDRGRRRIDPADVVRFLAEHEATILPAGIAASSARNRWVGIVTAVVVDTVAARVDLRCGPHRVVSLMTAESVDELGLEPGSIAMASVKSTAVVVEALR